jgi:hypothetical protein
MQHDVALGTWRFTPGGDEWQSARDAKPLTSRNDSAQKLNKLARLRQGDTWRRLRFLQHTGTGSQTLGCAAGGSMRKFQGSTISE